MATSYRALRSCSWSLLVLPCGGHSRAYFEVQRFERTGRFYELLGVVLFRRFAPDGDLANRWERRGNPCYRLIRGRRSAAEFVVRTEQSERGHIVLLALGIVSAAFAWSLGWHGWAVYLSVGNLVVNVYPILLQRYTRARIHTLLSQGSREGPRPRVSPPSMP